METVQSNPPPQILLTLMPNGQLQIQGTLQTPAQVIDLLGKAILAVNQQQPAEPKSRLLVAQAVPVFNGNGR